jgi:anti-sigma28 factor (negative regulator of flagellin synthesis)
MSGTVEGRAQAVTERTIQLNDLKASVEKSAYVVDSRAVAEALLQRVVDMRRGGGGASARTT